MKVAALLIIFVALVAAVLLGRAPREKVEPSPYRVLEIGETNPPLKRIGSVWPASTGTHIWLKTNQHMLGTITRCTDDQLFFTRPGNDQEFEERREGLAKYYTEAK